MNYGYAILSLFLGVGAYLVSQVIDRMWFARVGKKLRYDRWKSKVEERGVALIQAQMEVAALKQEFVGLIDEVPEGFEGAVLEVAKFGYAWERMVLREAEARGLYHPIDGGAGSRQLAATHEAAPQRPMPSAGSTPVASTAEPAMQWSDGKWVPR